MPSRESFVETTRISIAPDAIRGRIFAYPVCCHTAALYWMFRDSGDSHDVAIGKLLAISIFTQTMPEQYGSIPSAWFGKRLYPTATPLSRAQLKTLVKIGDILILGDGPMLPMHTMVVVTHLYTTFHQNTNIRGFNNHGTFGADAPRDAYDPVERHCDTDGMWHGNKFGYSVRNNLYLLKYESYRMASDNVRRNLVAPPGGGYTYTGPAWM